MNGIKSLYLTNRFFLLFGVIIGLFVASFPFSFLMPIAQTTLVLAIALVLLDILLLYNSKTTLRARRRLPKLFSMGDANVVYLDIHNTSGRALQLSVIDELPFQFQQRDFQIELELKAGEELHVDTGCVAAMTSGVDFDLGADTAAPAAEEEVVRPSEGQSEKRTERVP